MTSYPTPEFRRTALAPGILGAIVLLAGLALLDNAGGYLFIRFAVCILALIMCVFSWQAKQWWWIVGLLAIAVLWNPIVPFELHGQVWVALQFVGALLFIVVGIRVKVKNPEDRNRRR
ncbi:DUF6804 family protein [Glaciihabitans sp. UYNi722]|uniref:DUF6804 family protein n=1 Tax=Glaciihabitans sp. UYNi722 TaxID=3156344 RepID=UPI00339B8EC4